MGRSGARPDPPRVFFTHVMKTGGTSLSTLLRRRYDPATTYPPDTPGVDRLARKTFSDLLLRLDPGGRDRIRFFSVHQPAWVAAAVAPDAHTVTVLREPVARTISHLRQLAASPETPDDLEAIYDDEAWRRCLADYQTQLFADTRARHESLTAPPPDPDTLDDAERAAYAAGFRRLWGTGIAHPRACGPDDQARAAATLDGFDCVGVTEDLPGLVRRIVEVTGLDLPVDAVPRHNVTDRRLDVSPALLERIIADNEHDLRLYAHARALSGAGSGG